MGATSVTGVGKGSAGPVRGPGNNRNQFASLLDAHILFSGTVYMDSSTMTVDMPSTMKYPPENVTLLVSGKGVAWNKNLDGDGMVESFDIEAMKKKWNLDYVVVYSPSAKFTSNY